MPSRASRTPYRDTWPFMQAIYERFGAPTNDVGSDFPYYSESRRLRPGAGGWFESSFPSWVTPIASGSWAGPRPRSFFRAGSSPRASGD